MLGGVMHVREDAFMRVVELLLDHAMAELDEMGITKPADRRPSGSAFEFRWLAVKKLRQLTLEEKDAYLLEISKHLGLNPYEFNRTEP